MSGDIPLPLICLHGVHRHNYTCYAFYPQKTEQVLEVVVDINTKPMQKKKKTPNSYQCISTPSAR